jgi:hypothetical protein
MAMYAREGTTRLVAERRVEGLERARGIKRNGIKGLRRSFGRKEVRYAWKGEVPQSADLPWTAL